MKRPDKSLPRSIWGAGNVHRWHQSEDFALRNSGDMNHAHSARVAILLRLFWPEIEHEITIAALYHDLPEINTGDIAYPVKAENEDYRTFLSILEKRWHDKHGTPYLEDPRLHFCDKLDPILWKGHVKGETSITSDDYTFLEDLLRKANGGKREFAVLQALIDRKG